MSYKFVIQEPIADKTNLLALIATIKHPILSTKRVLVIKMQLKLIIFIFLISTTVVHSNESQIKETSPVVHITLLHINDVYEIMPINGMQGGLAKLSSVREQLLINNPNTYTIISGDLFSPSAMGTAYIDGQKLAGKQMVDLMNLIGLDYATLGNHEFDLNEQQFKQRLAESKFKWFSGNVLDKNSQSFNNVAKYEILEIKAANNKVLKIGLIGATINSNSNAYVTYKDPYRTINNQIKLLKDEVDILIAVTHLAIDSDIKLAETEPDLDIILGGHEHQNIQVFRGDNFTPIYKADANARSAYIHDLYYDTNTAKLSINSYLKIIDAQVPNNPSIYKRAKYWQDLAYSAFKRISETMALYNVLAQSSIK